MRNVIKRIANIVFVVVVLLLAAYTFLMAKYPEETAQITGYRLYAVLTDSMEPRIPTFSLVCTKVLDPEEPLHLKKGDIITFKADRFGDDILLTHHFKKQKKISREIPYTAPMQRVRITWTCIRHCARILLEPMCFISPLSVKSFSF